MSERATGDYFFFVIFLQAKSVRVKVMLSGIFFVGYKSSGTNLDFTSKADQRFMSFFAFCSVGFSGRKVSVQNQG